MEKQPVYKEIHYSKLDLDSKNPRFVPSKHTSNETEMIKWLLLEAATLELMQAIGENDFFKGEQLLVVKNKNNDNYKVIEGNRRLASIKLLHDVNLATVKKASVKEIYDNATFRPQEIPCLVFDKEEGIRKYLGFRHITGIKPWNLNEKARYLYGLYEYEKERDSRSSLDASCKKLAKIIGGRRDYVKRLLVAFMIYKKIEDEGFYSIRDLDETTFYVGYLSDSFRHGNICKFLGVDLLAEKPYANLNKTHLKELIHWFFEKNNQNKTRIKGKSDHLNKLNAILNDKYSTALKSFRAGKTLDEAHKYTEDVDSIFSDRINESKRNLETADSLTLDVNSFYSELDEDLIRIKELASKIGQFKKLKKLHEEENEL